MIAENKLKSKKNTEKAPKGRESWKDAKNQVRGNLEWALDFMKPREIIALLVRSNQSDLVEQNTVSEALLLKKYHEISASKIAKKLPEDASLGEQ